MNNDDNINNILNISYYKILNYKEELKNLYKIIFNFCHNKNIIIHNHNINLDVKHNLNYKLYDINNDFNFELLSINPYQDAVSLANQLFNNYSKYITMASYLNNKEIIITIDNNRLIKFGLLFSFSNKILKSIYNPTYKFKYDLNIFNIKYSSDILQLLTITHKLYNPTNFLKYINNYDNNINNNSNNSNLNNKKFIYKVDGYSLSDIYNELINNLLNIKYLEDVNIFNDIRSKILKYTINNINNDSYTDINIILLDSYALDNYNKKLIYKNINNSKLDNYNNILNIIIQKKYLNYLINIINQYLKNNKLETKYKVIQTTHNLYIVNDFRLEKNNIILNDLETNKNITLLITYNSSDYELFPIIYKINKILIPHPIVLIRFLLLNLFNLQILDPSYNESTYNNIINKIKTCYQFEKIINNEIKNKKIYLKYFGIFIDDKIEKYKLGSSIYRPWQYKLKNNKLLMIT